MSDWNPQANSLFLRALELPSADERLRYVDEACVGDSSLRADVEALLEASARAGSFLERPAPELDATRDMPVVTERAGTIIGPYKLLEQIGEGGFGVVFLAEQSRPVRRKVALKILKPGMDTRQVVARFEAERQALAIMDHPNIARVFDGGATESGRPYFVMELVKGVPITEFCDQYHLTPRQRLELFIPVCQAVQHAHQKGIIHRDLKPSNVLVSRHDTTSMVKVIDFGVAKATGQQLTEATLHTSFGAVVGTVEYMSPEQASFNQLDVDTRSDVYSLGVLLYELLTGSTPLQRKRAKETGLLEALRIVREEVAPTLSSRLSSTEELPAIAANRGTDPAKLTKLVRGELNWIVMKALEKDRNRRYETANGFAMDVQRYLNDEAVQACPPSATYRLRKFARRNKTALATAAALALLVLVVAGSIGWTLNERRERHRRNADEIVRAVDEGRKLQAQRRWPEALAFAQHARNLLDHTDGQDALRPRVVELINDLEMIRNLEDINLRKSDASSFLAIGFTNPAAEYHPAFQNYGLDVLALEVDAAAEEIRKRKISDYLVETLDDWSRMELDQLTRNHLRAVARKVNPEGTLARWRTALEKHDHAEMRKIIVSLEVASEQPATLAFLGRSAFQSGLRKESLELLLAAHAQHPDDFWINYDLAYAHLHTTPPQWDESLRHYTAALALRPRSHVLYLNIGVVRMSQGKNAAAMTAFMKSVELKPDFAPAHNNIGIVLTKDGKYDQAEAALQQAIDLQPAWVAPHNNLARLYIETNRTKKAFESFDRAIELDPKIPHAYSGRGVLWAREKEYDKAIADFNLALKNDDKFLEAYGGLSSVYEQKKQYADAVKWGKTALRHDPKSVETHCRLGATYSEWGRHEATNGSRKLATEMFDKAIDHSNEAIRLDANSGEAWYCLGNASRNRGQIRAAIAALEKAIVILDGVHSKKGIKADAHFNLGNNYRRLGDYLKAIDAYRAAIGANPDRAQAYANLGTTLLDQGNFDEAQKMYADALARDKKSLENNINFAVALDRQG